MSYLAKYKVEGLASIPNDLVKKAALESSHLIKKFCGGKQQIYFLEKDKQFIKI